MACPEGNNAMTNAATRDVEEVPRIGPIANGRIGDEPQKWGELSDFETADEHTQLRIDRAIERDRAIAEVVFKAELERMFFDIRSRREPTSVLHGLLVWGALSVPKLSGYLGMTINEVEDKLRALEMLSLVRPLPRDDDAVDDYIRYDISLRGLR
jgi:hypothetical protein